MVSYDLIEELEKEVNNLVENSSDYILAKKIICLAKAIVTIADEDDYDHFDHDVKKELISDEIVKAFYWNRRERDRKHPDTYEDFIEILRRDLRSPTIISYFTGRFR